MPAKSATPQKQAASGAPGAVKVGRPHMPKGYGIAKAPGGKGLLPWEHVAERMARAKNYWIGTARPQGGPHAMPVWGLWFEEKFYFSTDPTSRKARNLAADPRVAVHLESGDDVVIVEGVASQVSDKALIKSLDDAYEAKYGMRVSGMPGAVILGVAPRVVFAWREKDFNRCATRWQFGAA